MESTTPAPPSTAPRKRIIIVNKKKESEPPLSTSPKRRIIVLKKKESQSPLRSPPKRRIIVIQKNTKPEADRTTIDNIQSGMPTLTDSSEYSHITGFIASPRPSTHRLDHSHLKGALRLLKTPGPSDRRRWKSYFYIKALEDKKGYTGPDHPRPNIRLSDEPPTCLESGAVYQLSKLSRNEWIQPMVDKFHALQRLQAAEESDTESDEEMSDQESDTNMDSVHPVTDHSHPQQPVEQAGVNPTDITQLEEERELDAQLALAAKNLKCVQWKEDCARSTRAAFKRNARLRAEERRLKKIGTRASIKAAEALMSARSKRAEARQAKKD
ncbi:hypothetical protein QBC41DRAFT_308232 [Cercophora samala]|uniref:Uncharacterized protein n=1 Tax=Cercophora samala TaxID=330535 RepID=A0AA40D1H5_9PEZI|nr:hypothetical protein QBC41DRAFT_308232 [Cercophora samala]